MDQGIRREARHETYLQKSGNQHKFLGKIFKNLLFYRVYFLLGNQCIFMFIPFPKEKRNFFFFFFFSNDFNGGNYD